MNKSKISCIVSLLLVGLCYACKVDVETKFVHYYDSEVRKSFDSSDASISYLKLLDKYRTDDGPVLCISSLKAKSFIDSSIVTKNKFWTVRKGTVRHSMADAPESKTFVTYSSEYLEWLDQYSLTTKGKWIRPYYSEHQIITDISPSMIIFF